ncbi:AbrB/MazE/SpoVT family DNA-binding domain-containing protein [soil metagenome]
MRVTSKGQVTIPIAIREKLGLHPGTEVQFEVEGRAVRLRKVKGRDREFEEWLEQSWGSADTGMTTDEIMHLTRGE